MEASQELARAETGAAVVKAVPIPAQLQELGVRIGQDETSKMAVVVIPPQVRAALNVINPVSSFAQADPNWTPAISLVQLDKDLHSYNVAGKLGLNKQALETLAKAAGVLYTRTERVPKAELQEGELWAYRATAGFRRSDGTIDEVTRERGFNKEAEQDEIEQAVRTAKAYQSEALKFDTEEKVAAECKKRWLNELRFGPSKTESKAINRALRAGLQIPTSLKAPQFAKPFLVIGYNFTPDYDDVEVKRILVAAGLNAQAAIYGSRDVAGELGPASDVEGTSAPQPAELEPDLSPGPELGEQAGDGSGALAADGPVAGSSSEDPEPDLEVEAKAEEPAIKIPEKAIEDAGGFQTSKGSTVAEILALGEKGETWLLWALRNLGETEERAAIATFVEHRAPELWARFHEVEE